ncbi:hypothetical protein [Exiguobacterium alkaliphilum]|uniref:hypothetical protein n=1 Tax=Exiguobacterium alkaliphilum TaxID=1428684 RepID=UPI001BAAF50A|nr:hypothetical protein [Exiguobacterium alkaliphilum]QUE87166.1 hypothetical protein KB235_04510 [Exiguobacterium alkaliphilum]
MHNLEFLTPDHFETFKHLVRRLNDPGQTSRQYFAALYLIAGNKQVQDILLPYVELEKGQIRTGTIIDDNTFDKEVLTLVKLVIHLYNNKEWVLPTELISLTEDDYTLAMQAITLCRDAQFDDITIPTKKEA